MTLTAPVIEANPLREGLEQERVPDASCLVIFGASGDLTQRKLIPALYSLAHDGLLPAGQTIIGYARPDYTDDAFRMAMREACDKHARVRPVDEAVWENFAKGLFYVRGDSTNPRPTSSSNGPAAISACSRASRPVSTRSGGWLPVGPPWRWSTGPGRR